ncbi:MAG: zinc-ribbon domain-containing protein [Lachnospiraceae bacterium]|nr:zinc-ribbon domain-containing protein [Lachnospiraceae bacterium]
MFCPNCGTQLPDGAGFCSNCGYSLSGASAARAPKQENLSIEILKRAFQVILKKPFRLWGLSLLCALLAVIAYILGGPVIGIGFAVSLVLNLGMEWIYLDGYRGKEVDSKQLFEPFQNFWKSFAGMGWRELWLLLWALIPFAGLVFAVIKTYAYQLTPYILREGEYSPQEALKESMRRTEGYKGKMFLTDLLIFVVIFVPLLILALLGMIPYVGILFDIIYVIVTLVVSLFGGLYTGLVRAAWYEEICGNKE